MNHAQNVVLWLISRVRNFAARQLTCLTWRVVLASGQAFVIRNVGPHNRGMAPSGGGVITCQGRLGTGLQPSCLTP